MSQIGEKMFHFAILHPLEQSLALTVITHAQLINKYVKEGATVEEAKERMVQERLGNGVLQSESFVVNTEGIADLAVHFYQFILSSRPEVYNDTIKCSCPKCTAEREANENKPS